VARVLITGGAEDRRDLATGRYQRTLPIWTPEHWDAGWLTNKGRFMVYRPDCPTAFVGGRALRYHVVYWLVTGEAVPKGFVLHHRNGIKTDDRFENLELMSRGDHARHHNPRRPRMLVCEHCGEEFSVNHRRGKHPTRFCSQACYHAHPRSEAHKAALAAVLQCARTARKR
jgi:hypothetical protein